MPNKSEQDFKSLVESKKVIGTESSPLVLNRAELEGVNLSDVHFENVIFNDLALLQVRLDRAYFKNVIFNSCVSLKWRFDYATMDNVIFNKCKLRSFNPMGVTFINTSFNRTNIDAASFAGAKGSDAVLDSKLDDLDIGDTDISWTITNSTLNKIEAFKIGGSITLNDSTFTDANLEFGEMDSFEAYNSTIDALGPTTIRNQLVIKGGKVEWSGMNAGSVHIDGISAQRFSMSYGDMGNVLIENCRNLGVLGFSQSKMDTLHVRNCKIDDFGGHATIANLLQFEDVSIHDLVLAESDIQRWKMHNVQLTGKLNFELGTIREKQFTNVDVDRKAVINLRNTTFSFP
jgi:uncharacterized protein YjbI with pentapeptide repeats